MAAHAQAQVHHAAAAAVAPDGDCSAKNSSSVGGSRCGPPKRRERYERIRARRHRTDTDTATFDVRIPSSDIDSCIKFSYVRLIYSIIGMLLVASDIPRTGNGVQTILDSFERTAPSTMLYFGPYAYGVAQITKTANASTIVSAAGVGGAGGAVFTGTCDDATIASTDVWSYKFDTLSIAFRSVVELFSVTEYPQCLRYIGTCPSTTLSLETTFTMLDALANRVAVWQRKLQSHTRLVIAYVVQSYWIDRVGHYLFAKFAWRRVDTRFGAVYYYDDHVDSSNSNSNNWSTSQNLCPIKSGCSPIFCDQLVPWTVDEVVTTTTPDGFSTTTATTKRVKISDHIAHRFAALQHAHPHLRFDLTIFTTRFPTVSTMPLPILPTVRFRSDNNEVTTLIRGRQCSRNNNTTPSNRRTNNNREKERDAAVAACETVLVDDYRYEVAALETNIGDWYWFTAAVRAAAQAYMWLRLVLLWLGCYYARRREPAFAAASFLQRMRLTASTVFKIPSHIIIYGSSLPLTLYALAHYIDSGVVHTLCENVMSSLNGAIQVNVFVYMTIASVQMRNIWYIALALQCVAAAQIIMWPPRRVPWTPARGFLGVRGGVVGVISFVTMFGFLRVASFRFADLQSVHDLAPQSLQLARQFDPIEPSSEFGFVFDVRMLSLVTALLVGVVVVLKLYVVLADSPLHRAVQRHLVIDADAVTRVGASRMLFLPYSVGTVVPWTALSLFWKITIAVDAEAMDKGDGDGRRHGRREDGRGATFSRAFRGTRTAKVSAGAAHAQPQRPLPASSYNSSSRRRRTYALHQETLLHVGRRSTAHWSVVQLMNIALLTEPLAFMRLYVTGHELSLYTYTRAVSTSTSTTTTAANPTLFLLPCDARTLARNTSDAGDVYARIATIDSRCVPWHLLVFCG